MATGFMGNWLIANIRMAGLLLLSFPIAAAAANITVVGLFPNKAVLVIDGAAPRTMTVGQLSDGVKLMATDGKSATVEVDGKTQVLEIGEHFATSAPGSRQSVTLSADTRGHFLGQGSINGGSVRMLVDTGATMIALPARDAERLGIDYKKGAVGSVQTANGSARAYKVRLDLVQLGDVRINQVDAVVIEGGLEVALLGMSFLNRMEMKRDGDTMTLMKRF